MNYQTTILTPLQILKRNNHFIKKLFLELKFFRKEFDSPHLNKN